MSRVALICLTGLLTSAMLIWTTSVAHAETEDPAAPKINVIHGQVIDQQGNPVPNARIGIANAEKGVLFLSNADELRSYGDDELVLWFFTKRNGCAVKEITSNEQGKFKATSIKDGRLNLLALHAEKGYAVMTDVEYPSEDEMLTVTLSPKASFNGSIEGLPDSTGIQLAGLRMASMTPAKDIPGIYINQYLYFAPDSRAVLESIPCPPIDWKITLEEYVREKGFSATILEVPVKLTPGQETTLDLDLSASNKFTGEVKGPKGEPLHHVSVVLRQNAAPKIAYGAITDAKGKYTIQGPPPGEYVLEAKRWAKRTAPG